MKIEKIQINNIPALIFGVPSDKAYIFVHGKMSCKEQANDFAEIAAHRGYQTISFDLPEHGERVGSRERCDVWNGIRDLNAVADYAFDRWGRVSLFACSLGAYFSLQSYEDRTFQNCLFLSPIVDMEYLVRQMFLWFGVTEKQLKREGEVATPVDPLRWDYFQYILSHPVKKWNVPTAILYGGKDEMQSREMIERFAKDFCCKLTVSEQSEHPFMKEEDGVVVRNWLTENI